MNTNRPNTNPINAAGSPHIPIEPSESEEPEDDAELEDDEGEEPDDAKGFVPAVPIFSLQASWQLTHAWEVTYGPWQNPPSESHWPFPHALAQQLFRQVIGVSLGA
ncbi:MAG: hypothetical protein NTY68_04840 [Candidatus Micrarchaeota archaeon]|nr:hypothetical protein [Candidatus Micrarchaeota archaeon]